MTGACDQPGKSLNLSEGKRVSLLKYRPAMSATESAYYRYLRDCVTLSNSHFAQLAACLADMHAHYVVAYNYAKGTFGSSETYDIRTITQETCPLLMLSTLLENLQLNRVVYNSLFGGANINIVIHWEANINNFTVQWGANISTVRVNINNSEHSYTIMMTFLSFLAFQYTSIHHLEEDSTRTRSILVWSQSYKVP